MNKVHNNRALLVMDVQPGIVDRYTDKESYLGKVSKAIKAAKTNQIPVIYVVVGFREGMPEVSPNNKSFSIIKQDPAGHLVSPKPALAVDETAIVVTKRRVSAFTGSDLEVVLRANGIRHIILCGIATSGVVLSTLREAADKDYQITVLADLCVNADEQVHKTLIEKIFPRQAEVITSNNWL